jgi:S1-C subfamily serine protease
MKPILRSPFVSAAVGGLAVAGVLLALGVTGRRTITTVIEEAPLATDAASNAATGLTPYEIYQHDAPSVVFVRADVDQAVVNPFALSTSQQTGVSTGSGFLVDRRGDILTNYHIIAGASAGEVSVEFEHGVTKVAQVVGQNPSNDLAMLRVSPRGVNVAPLTLGNSASAQVGDPTLVIGNPFGLDRTLASGIISALQRQMTAPGGFAINNVIQTDVPFNPGTAGGPLIDAAGRVIGISAQIETGGVPVGFAVPSNTARALLPRLEGPAPAPPPAYLGIAGVTIQRSLLALGIGARHGVLVRSVDPGGPAAAVGLRAGRLRRVAGGQRVYVGGDVIERIDGTTAGSVDDLSRVVASKRPGQVVDLTVLRGSRVHTLEVTLGSGPSGG